jgi:hypothetical protein
MAPKPGLRIIPGISLAGSCLLARWCPVYRQRESDSGWGMELGKSLGDAKRKPISANREGEISMHLKMADRPAVAWKCL